jgi:pyruvate-formate lyase-activating enzyme
MCTYHCSPWSGGLLNSKVAVQALAEAARHPLRYVMLFGGEPFLTYNLLLELTHESKRLTDAPVTVFTNAFWATSRRRALALLKPLADAGTSRLYLSLDSYHADYVSPGRVATAALMADHLGLEVFTDAAIPPGLSAGNPEARRTRAIIRKFERKTGIRVIEKPFTSTGRAAALPDGPPEDLSICRLPDYLGCSLAAPRGVELHPGGEVCLCSGISLGNLENLSLGEILASYDPECHPVLGPLLHGGPGALLKMAVDRGRLEPGVLRSPTSRCRACYIARSALRPDFPEALRPAQCYGAT